MAQSKGSTKGEEGRYKRYLAESKYSINKRKKLDRHLKKHPEDVCAKKARGDIALYRRKAPKTPHWTKGDIKEQMIFVITQVGKKQKGRTKGGDVRKIRENAINEVSKHLNLSTKNQKEGHVVKPREFKTNIFQLGQRARYV